MTLLTQPSLLDEPEPSTAPEPDLPLEAICAGCGASILWARTRSGKAIPLDLGLKHVSNRGRGKRLMLIDATGAVVQGFECNPAEKGAKAGRVTHFSTCPKAHTFRKGANK